jgi:hypothetical protein
VSTIETALLSRSSSAKLLAAGSSANSDAGRLVLGSRTFPSQLDWHTLPVNRFPIQSIEFTCFKKGWHTCFLSGLIHAIVPRDK